MTEMQLITIVVSLIGGGAMGAILNMSYTAYRNRIQPIARRVEFLSVFKDTFGTSSLRTQIVVSDGKKDYRYRNLHIAQIQVVNRGNKDFSEFAFGVSLSPEDVAVYIDPQSSDRHHEINQITSISLSKPKSEIDFCLRPLNRGDTYTLRIFIVTPQGKEHPGEIRLSSSESIRFVDVPTISEIISELATYSPFLEIGPLRMSVSPLFKRIRI